MFIQQLDLEEFRGIKKCKEPIKFTRFNVLIGRNNSGKSTILEALYLLPIPSYYNEPFSRSERIKYLQKLTGGKNSLVYAYSGKAKLTYWVDKGMLTFEINDEAHLEKVKIDEKGSLSIPTKLTK